MPKAVAVYNADALHHTFRQIAAGDTAGELEAIADGYRSTIPRDDGTTWCSRLPEGDPRIGSSYETQFCRWIPGDTRAALRAVIVIIRPDDLEELNATLATA